MGNPFVHVELSTNDVSKAKSFYGKLFDWKLEDLDMGGATYTMVKVGDGTGGGMMKSPTPGMPAMWLPYILVSDVKSATAKAKSLGAIIMKDVSELPNMGWFSIITDPTGAIFGMWQSKS